MSRNKHPEETVTLILDVATRLFLEKGYEYTSIQDIIDNLGGLSKGAIYHHFKSKEEILAATIDRIAEDSTKQMEEIASNPALSGKEKLKAMFHASMGSPEQTHLFKIAPSFDKNPKLLFMMVHDSIDNTAPNYILPVIEQGIADGSIHTDHPKQLAELMIFVANIWLNPMIFSSTAEDTAAKFAVMNQMLQNFGLDILDEEILQGLLNLTDLYQERGDL